MNHIIVIIYENAWHFVAVVILRNELLSINNILYHQSRLIYENTGRRLEPSISTTYIPIVL